MGSVWKSRAEGYNLGRMKRWMLIIMIVVAISSAAMVLSSHVRSEARTKREADYQAAVQAYSRALKPGLTRIEVENYLHAKAATLTQMCCIGERSAYADLVKVGEEGAPWYCSENYVHVAFEFAATEPHEPWKAYETDVLRRVLIFRQLGGCL